MKRFVEGEDRSQSTLFPERLDDYIAEDNPVRVIDGNVTSQECGRWLNNRAEILHQQFRRREGAMARFRDIRTLQKFAAVHASIHNHFNQDRHLNTATFSSRTALLLWPSGGNWLPKSSGPTHLGTGTIWSDSALQPAP